MKKTFTIDFDFIWAFSKKSKFEIVYFVMFVSFVETIKNFASFESMSSISSIVSLFDKTILRFNINFAFDVDIDYDFKNWNYVKIRVFLSLVVESTNVCLDIDVDVSLINRTFFKTQTSNTFVRTMIFSLQIRDLSTNRHQIWKYVVCDIYLSKSKNDKNVISLIQREVHLVNNFKINMLIDNDIIESEQFIIDMKIKQTIIENIDVSISIEVKSTKTSLQRVIHLKKTAIISSHIEMIISVHNVNLFVFRDFLFESKNTKLIMYVHLIDVSITAILIRNDKNVSVKISRNYRLDRVFELDFSNVFHIEESDDVRHFAIKKSKTFHRNEWFKKFISVCVTTYVVVVVIEIETTLIDFSNLVNVFMSSFTSEVFDLSVASLFDVTSDVKSILRKSFTNVFNSSKIVLFNDVTIYNFESNIVDFFVKIVNDFSTLWHDIDFVNMFENKWMRIFLKSDWETRVFDKIKIYSLKIKDRELIDQTFDEFHRIDKLFWTNESTSFSYSIFCVWKTIERERKNRMIVDIRDLNVITQSNVYSLSFQTNILTLIRDCKYIFVIDCSAFFYQWRIHSIDRHKFIVVNHRNQESFNVTIMNYKNSSTYVQRQIDRLLRTFREFAHAYVDDIMIFSHIRKKHEFHLQRVFIVLIENNIFVKIVKAFLDYSSISLLDQKVDSFDLIIFEKKLKTISKLRFSRTLRQLEIYLSLIDWMRNYVFYYVDIFKSFQDRKIEFLRHDLTIDSARRFYSIKIRLKDSTELKIIFFEILQIMLSKFFYLIHVDIKRSLFIDLNVNKKFDFEVMLYYVKKFFLKNNLKDKYFSRHAIESILFLNRFVIDVKSRYWSTELEIADIVWILKKTRHIVEISDKSIIYIDHDATLEIVNQIILIISSIDKLNLRLIKAFDYI